MNAVRFAVLVVTSIALASGVNAAADKFHRLKGPQIQARFAGMELTDGVHWGEVFGPNGVLTVYSMGRKSVGKWWVKNDELCEDRGEEFKGCYQVWMNGGKVELRREGSSLPIEGVLQKPAKRS
jgi:hypothetical protein